MPLKADTITKDYLSDAAVFADVFNYYIHDGEQVICPEQLEERDPTEIALPYGADGAAVPVQKFRDAQKLYTAMTDGNLEYVLYGIEAQAEIHYAAAVKNNLYDAIEYAGQVEEAARSHRRAMKQAKEQKGDASAAGLGKPNSGEFLSGFWKSDKLVPSVTVMLYFSPDAWDGPLSLFDMMDVKDPKIFSFLDNYHVRLIAPAQMADEEIMKFQSSLREVMLFIKYSKDRDNLSRILETNEKRFREVERRAADVIETITHTGLKYDESEEVVDVCQAIQEMRKESERDGELKKAKEAAGNFYNLGVDVEKIAQGVGYAVETVKEWLGLE
ncbi:MAG: transposase [Lachnospiraceae bacterium]|jgi:hypothetical protein|nr:transposase [Lachnospiraceae bacterium]MCI9599772.1 transposase [Lachnospiraceae bacterium]